mgnify:CR=1 FL=1
MQFARGARGALVQQIQQALDIGADGVFGKDTAAAVAAAQARHALPATGAVDEATWAAVVGEPFPTLFERCLALTAAFEGHGYGKAAGNFDGAGITWGIIGFNLKSGSLGKVLSLIPAADVDTALGALAPVLREVLVRPQADRVRWGDSLSTGEQKRLQPAWYDALARLGDLPSARTAQRAVAAESYWTPSQTRMSSLAPFLTTPRASALFFDAHVQQGGVKESAAQAAQAAWKQAGSEPAALLAMADTQALSTSARWREDVRSRRRCVATGTGTVHGRAYALTAWGLA